MQAWTECDKIALSACYSVKMLACMDYGDITTSNAPWHTYTLFPYMWIQSRSNMVLVSALKQLRFLAMMSAGSVRLNPSKMEVCAPFSWGKRLKEPIPLGFAPVKRTLMNWTGCFLLYAPGRASQGQELQTNGSKDRLQWTEQGRLDSKRVNIERFNIATYDRYAERISHFFSKYIPHSSYCNPYLCLSISDWKRRQENNALFPFVQPCWTLQILIPFRQTSDHL